MSKKKYIVTRKWVMTDEVSVWADSEMDAVFEAESLPKDGAFEVGKPYLLDIDPDDDVVVDNTYPEDW